MDLRHTSHTVNNLQVYLVWVTEYRYHVLRGDVQLRSRDILCQVCNSLDIRIIKGVAGKDHAHLHLSYPPQLCISNIVKRLKDRSSRLLLRVFPELKRCYRGNHFRGIGYDCRNTCHTTEDMLESYHRYFPDSNDYSFMPESCVKEF